MSIHNRKISLLYKYILLILALISFISAFLAYSVSLSSFNYFQVIVAIATIVYYIFSCVRIMKNHREYDNENTDIEDSTTASIRIKGAIIVSAFANIFFLSFSGTTTPSTLFLGVYILPIMMFVDWLLFDKKGIFAIRDILIWLFVPVVYYLYIILLAQIGIVYGNKTHYPYSFMDSSTIGFSTVIKNMIIFVLLFFVIGALLLLSDILLNAYGHKLNRQMKALDNEVTNNQQISHDNTWYGADDFSNGILTPFVNSIDSTEKAELNKVIATETMSSPSAPLFDEKEFPLLAELNILAKLKMPSEKNEKVTIESLCAAINNVAQADGIDISTPKQISSSGAKITAIDSYSDSISSSATSSEDRKDLPSAAKIPEMNAVPIRIKNKSYTTPYPSMSASNFVTSSFTESVNQPAGQPINDPPVVSYVEGDEPVFDPNESFSGVPLTTLTNLPAVKPIAELDKTEDYARYYAIPIQPSIEISPSTSTTSTTFGSTALSGYDSPSTTNSVEPEYDNEPHRPAYYNK